MLIEQKWQLHVIVMAYWGQTYAWNLLMNPLQSNPDGAILSSWKAFLKTYHLQGSKGIISQVASKANNCLLTAPIFGKFLILYIFTGNAAIGKNKDDTFLSDYRSGILLHTGEWKNWNSSLPMPNRSVFICSNEKLVAQHFATIHTYGASMKARPKAHQISHKLQKSK